MFALYGLYKGLVWFSKSLPVGRSDRQYCQLVVCLVTTCCLTFLSSLLET